MSVTQPQLAERAGIAQSSLSKHTRGESKPEAETVRKIWGAILSIATENGWQLDTFAEESFMNAAAEEGYASRRQIAISQEHLTVFTNGIQVRRENRRLRWILFACIHAVEQRDKRLQDLHNELRKERAKRVPWGQRGSRPVPPDQEQ